MQGARQSTGVSFSHGVDNDTPVFLPYVYDLTVRHGQPFSSYEADPVRQFVARHAILPY